MGAAQRPRCDHAVYGIGLRASVCAPTGTAAHPVTHALCRLLNTVSKAPIIHIMSGYDGRAPLQQSLSLHSAAGAVD